MTEGAVTALGALSGLLTTAAFLPQFVKTFRDRDVAGLSRATYAVLTAGILGWLVYGVMRRDLALAASNAIMLVLVAGVAVMAFRFPRGDAQGHHHDGIDPASARSTGRRRRER